MAFTDWVKDVGSDIVDYTKSALGGDPFLDKKAAQQQQAAADAALQKQLEEAQRAREFMKQQSDQGLGFIDQGTGAAADNIGLYSGLSRGALGHGFSIARDDLTGAHGEAVGALRGGNTTARNDLMRLAGLQGYEGQATNAVGAYDVVGQQPGRLAALADGGLAAGFQADPGYQFRLQQGEEAINRSAAARGGRLGGATLKALSEYNQGLASQEFGNYANRAIGMAQGADSQNMQALLNQAGRQDQASLAAQANAMGLTGMGYGAQSSMADLAAQGGTQEAALNAQRGSELAGFGMQYGQQLAGSYAGQGGSLADLYSSAGNNKANISIGAGTQNTALSQSMMGAYNNPVQYAGSAANAQGNTAKNLFSTLMALKTGGASAKAGV